MEVLTIEHSAFQQLISKIDAMDEFIRKAKLEQQSSLDDDWVDGQAVCEYLCICDKTLQRLRSANCVSCGVAFREAKNATNSLSSKSFFPDKSIKKRRPLH